MREQSKYSASFFHLFYNLSPSEEAVFNEVSCLAGTVTSVYLTLCQNWKLYLFLEHQYQPVSSFLLTAAILVYPYLQFKYCLCTSNKNQHALMLFNGNRFCHVRFPLNKSMRADFCYLCTDSTWIVSILVIHSWCCVSHISQMLMIQIIVAIRSKMTWNRKKYLIRWLTKSKILCCLGHLLWLSLPRMPTLAKRYDVPLPSKLWHYCALHSVDQWFPDF